MSVYVCFSLKASLIDKKSTDVLEKEYQSVFKPILKCMLSHPNLRISFSFTGIQMEYYRRKHSEMFEILHELIQRKQAEVLGGGYYDPVFPLLFPQDRTGQIDLLSSSIRETTEKDPADFHCVQAAGIPECFQAFHPVVWNMFSWMNP